MSLFYYHQEEFEKSDTLSIPSFYASRSQGVPGLSAEDIVKGNLLAMERGRIGERYILGGENISVHEIVEKAIRELGYAPGTLREGMKLTFRWLQNKDAPRPS